MSVIIALFIFLHLHSNINAIKQIKTLRDKISTTSFIAVSLFIIFFTRLLQMCRVYNYNKVGAGIS